MMPIEQAICCYATHDKAASVGDAAADIGSAVRSPSSRQQMFPSLEHGRRDDKEYRLQHVAAFRPTLD